MYLTWKQDLTRWPSVFSFPLNYKRNGTWSQPKHLGRDWDYDVRIFSAKCRPNACSYSHIEEQQNECPCDSSNTTATWLEAHQPENSDILKPLVKPSLKRDKCPIGWHLILPACMESSPPKVRSAFLPAKFVWCLFIFKQNIPECQHGEIAPYNGNHNTEVITSEYLPLCRHDFVRAKVNSVSLNFMVFSWRYNGLHSSAACCSMGVTSHTCPCKLKLIKIT